MSIQQAGQVRHVGEREARRTAEEARQAGWRQPSFGKQLFLGDLRLDLIHPHPRPGEESSRRGEEFCARLREFCEASVDGALIERDALIPDDVVKGLAAIGSFGMKIAPEYGGLGAVPSVLQPGANHRRVRLAGDCRAAFGAPVDRGAAAAGAVRDRRAEAAVPAAVRPR